MKRLLLMLAMLGCLAVGAHGQDSGAAPASPAPESASPAAAAIAAPAQPIPFNHQLHTETAKLGCKDCHESVRNGSTLAIPQPPKCMLCHAAIATDKPDIQRIAALAKANENVAWVRVYRVPSFVTFSHKIHTSAGATCEDCHGDVAKAVAIAPVKDMHMGGCIACHQAKNAPATCDTCHEIQAKNGRSPWDADAAVVARLQGPAVPARRALPGLSAFLFAPAL